MLKIVDVMMVIVITIAIIATLLGDELVTKFQMMLWQFIALMWVINARMRV